MPRNLRGGKGAKALSNKKEKSKEQESSRPLEYPNEDQIFCFIEKIYGGGRYDLKDLKNQKKYVGLLPRQLKYSRPQIGSVVIAQYRMCNTTQRNIDIVHIYTSDEVEQLKEKDLIDVELDPNDFKGFLSDDCSDDEKEISLADI